MTYAIVVRPPMFTFDFFTYRLTWHETPAEEILGFVSGQYKEAQMEMHSIS